MLPGIKTGPFLVFGLRESLEDLVRYGNTSPRTPMKIEILSTTIVYIFGK